MEMGNITRQLEFLDERGSFIVNYIKNQRMIMKICQMMKKQII